MSANKGNMVLYGIDNISDKLDNIVKKLNLSDQYFETKLIITEAVSNAYIHGNNCDNSKPISIQWELKDNLIRIIVKDCGQGIKALESYNRISEENILDECGRGLYIIRCYSDEVEFRGNSIIMEKYLGIGAKELKV